MDPFSTWSSSSAVKTRGRCTSSTSSPTSTASSRRPQLAVHENVAAHDDQQVGQNPNLFHPPGGHEKHVDPELARAHPYPTAWETQSPPAKYTSSIPRHGRDESKKLPLGLPAPDSDTARSRVNVSKNMTAAPTGSVCGRHAPLCC